MKTSPTTDPHYGITNHNPVDIHVGARMRLRRQLLGLSQTDVGERLGVTFQQLQKYERGTNRISASRLFDAARVLEVPVSFFFDGITEATAAASPANRTGSPAPEPTPSAVTDPMLRRETLEVVRAYYLCPPPLRNQVRGLLRSVADAVAGKPDDADHPATA